MGDADRRDPQLVRGLQSNEGLAGTLTYYASLAGDWRYLTTHLAKLETRVLFEELLPRLADIELAGPAERMRSNFVNGIKHMPVRVRRA